MAIQWFPGHMNKARRELADKLEDIDVIIEMCDARLPMSSSNPMIAELAAVRQRPQLKILNKQDLADPAVTRQWIDWFAAQADTGAIALDTSESNPRRKIIDAARALVPNRVIEADRPLRLVVCYPADPCEALRAYWPRLLRVFDNAALENERLQVIYREQ